MQSSNDQSFTLIDLDQNLLGYRQFLSCWVYKGPKAAVIVDPGPTSTADLLAARLADLGIRRVDLILVTHVHLDHAGGVGRLLEHFPMAHVFCHPKGKRHLQKPTRLWEGSIEVLGDVAEQYGEPLPVPPIAFAEDAELRPYNIRAIPTPGHASHHLSFIMADNLLIGEAISTRCPVPPPHQDALYLRPATPPRFFPETTLASIDTLLAVDPLPDDLLFAHYGRVKNARNVIERARAQILQWLEAVEAAGGANLPAEPSTEAIEDLASRVHERMLEEDPLYRPFINLEPDIQQRERYYVHQSVAGMAQHLRSKNATS
jgi:glyoxylase-like metal-dependent hydrolase (beta-lactamase superfamily II)